MSGEGIRGAISRHPTQSASTSPESVYAVWRSRILNLWNATLVSGSSYTQVPQDPDQSQLQGQDPDSMMEASRLMKARWRTYWLAAVLCCGGALFGYDSGVIGKFYEGIESYRVQKLMLCSFVQAVFSRLAHLIHHFASPLRRRLGSAPLQLVSSRLEPLQVALLYGPSQTASADVLP